MEPWLFNPELLDLLLADYTVSGSWPTTRLELFGRACDQLLREENRTHAEVDDRRLSAVDVSAAADRLAAIALIANRSGFAPSREDAAEGFIDVLALGGAVLALRAAVRRRPLAPVGLRRAVPRRRMVAEFMAARHVRDRLRAGLPLSRVLALITGWDGGALSDLRGVHAWLVALARLGRPREAADP